MLKSILGLCLGFMILSCQTKEIQHEIASTPVFDDLSYFPSNYDAARLRFVKYLPQIQNQFSRVDSHKILVGSESLSIDTIYIPAQKKPKSLIIVTSGNHGPEGYAGSALQFSFIENVLPHLDLSETGVLLIHALNPWGYKHHRRGTENNVNLNRNFDISPDLFKTINAEYMKLRENLEPEGPVKSSVQQPANSLVWKMLTSKSVTQQSLTEAIGKGQYTSARGINYGGQSFEPQVPKVIDLLVQTAQPYKSIFHIDLHTGLGKNGVLHIMTKNKMNQNSLIAQKKLFLEAEKDLYEITPPDAEGFYEILGDYATVLTKGLRPQDQRTVIGITAEFGTVGNGLLGKVKTINRLILENQGYFYGYETQIAQEKIQRRHLELFYPDSESWKKDVLIKGHYLLDTVVRRFMDQQNRD